MSTSEGTKMPESDVKPPVTTQPITGVVPSGAAQTSTVTAPKPSSQAPQV